MTNERDVTGKDARIIDQAVGDVSHIFHSIYASIRPKERYLIEIKYNKFLGGRERR